MKKKLTTVEFHGTPEQEARLLAVIEEHKGIKGAMMPILQKAQVLCKSHKKRRLMRLFHEVEVLYFFHIQFFHVFISSAVRVFVYL